MSLDCATLVPSHLPSGLPNGRIYEALRERYERLTGDSDGDQVTGGLDTPRSTWSPFLFPLARRTRNRVLLISSFISARNPLKTVFPGVSKTAS